MQLSTVLMCLMSVTESSDLPPVQLISSATLLLYTAIIVPVQICMWNYEDPCNNFPTLSFDVVVDSFFLVIDPVLIECGALVSSKSLVSLRRVPLHVFSTTPI
jgi:hypothetical protein